MFPKLYLLFTHRAHCFQCNKKRNSKCSLFYVSNCYTLKLIPLFVAIKQSVCAPPRVFSAPKTSRLQQHHNLAFAVAIQNSQQTFHLFFPHINDMKQWSCTVVEAAGEVVHAEHVGRTFHERIAGKRAHQHPFIQLPAHVCAQ